MSSWQPKRRSEVEYSDDIFKILLEVFKDAPEFLGTLLGRFINNADFIERWVHQAAERMVTLRYQEGKRTWQAAARQSGQGAFIYAELQRELQGPVGIRYRQLIAHNAELIKTLPPLIASKASEFYANLEGERAKPIDIIRHLTRVEANRIARTETSKASSALTRARAEQLNLNWYVWRTSEDARVRFAHRKIAGVLVAFNDPPAPEHLVGERSTAGHYHAGEIWNCRCYEEVLLRLDQVGWPHRVYHGGRITVLTLAAFRRFSNLPQPLAA